MAKCMARKTYDATKEHAPFERSGKPTKGHPNKGLKEKNPYSGKKAE